MCSSVITWQNDMCHFEVTCWHKANKGPNGSDGCVWTLHPIFCEITFHSICHLIAILTHFLWEQYAHLSHNGIIHLLSLANPGSDLDMQNVHSLLPVPTADFGPWHIYQCPKCKREYIGFLFIHCFQDVNMCFSVNIKWFAHQIFNESF